MITCDHALRGVAQGGSFVLPEPHASGRVIYDHGREDLPHRSGNQGTCDAIYYDSLRVHRWSGFYVH